MKNWILGLFLFASMAGAQAFQPRNAMCINPSGNWIAINASSIVGASTQVYSPIDLFGQNANGSWYPLACDVNGNLVNGSYPGVTSNGASGLLMGPSAANYNTATFWGDSLTCGCLDGTGLGPGNNFGIAVNQPINNEGIGGQTSTQIAARQSGVSTYVTNTFTIPTSACAVNPTFTVGAEPGFNAVLSSTNVPSGFTGVLGTISGVSGLLTDNGSHVYTFTPMACPASPVVVSANTQWFPTLGNLLNGPQIIAVGRNNFSNQSQILSDVAAMVAKIGNQPYLVTSILNSEAEPSGSANYITIAADNAALAAAYSSHYLDTRANLIAHYNPAVVADVYDNTNDIPPFSLRGNYTSGLGTVTTAISNTSTCTFTTSLSFAPGTVIQVNSEQIRIDTASGGSVTGCDRAWNGTAAATHTLGVAVSLEVDYLHLGGTTGYAVEGAQEATAIEGQVSSAITLASLYGALAGVASPNNGNFTSPVTSTGGATNYAYIVAANKGLCWASSGVTTTDSCLWRSAIESWRFGNTTQNDHSGTVAMKQLSLQDNNGFTSAPLTQASWSVAGGAASVPSGNQGAIYYIPAGQAIVAVTASLTGSPSCTVAPTVAIMDCGTAVACGSPTSLTTLATGTTVGNFSSTGLSVALATGHYYAMQFSAGTCSTTPTVNVALVMRNQ